MIKYMNKKTYIIIGFVVVAGLSFYAGTKYNQNSASGRGNGTAFQRGNGARNAGGVVSGEILSKDDTSITVKTRDGGSKIVFLTKNTPVMKSVPGANDDLGTGTSVMVIGNSNADGSVNAQSIQIRAATTTSVNN